MHSDNEMVNLRSVIETLLYMIDEDSDGVEEIMQLPTIELVRCKECKYCVDAGAQRALVCDNSYIDMDIHPDDFCSYGERKEGE